VSIVSFWDLNVFLRFQGFQEQRVSEGSVSAFSDAPMFSLKPDTFKGQRPLFRVGRCVPKNRSNRCGSGFPVAISEFRGWKAAPTSRAGLRARRYRSAPVCAEAWGLGLRSSSYDPTSRRAKRWPTLLIKNCLSEAIPPFDILYSIFCGSAVCFLTFDGRNPNRIDYPGVGSAGSGLREKK
jgi:hypothetical protein